MIDPQQLYHIGVVVPDIDRALDELGSALGHRWTSIREMALNLNTASGPGSFAARVAFSRQGPPWLEIIEGPSDSIWSAVGGASLHHLAFVVDDLQEESRRLAALGMEFELSGTGPDGRMQGFAYHRNPHGGRIEIVEPRLRDSLERWLSEGL